MNSFEEIVSAVLNGANTPFMVRKLVVDYKAADGTDMNHDSFVFGLKTLSDNDATVVDEVLAEHAQKGERVSCIMEIDPVDNTAIGCLYLNGEALLKLWNDLGIKPPDDVKANLDSAGIHPVNYESLINQIGGDPQST